MGNVLVSVIIPAYNVEKYISRCLDSVINQTLKDIEIIVIDDGSIDKTYDILEEYQKRDSRIKLIKQSNKKQGAARNRGLEIATGSYITFVDSDDWIEADYLNYLYTAAKENNVNLALASMTRDKKNKIKEHLFLKDSSVYIGAEKIISAIDRHLETAGKLYKRECIFDLRFIENIFYEDGPYTIRAIYRTGTAVTVPNAVYHYVSNTGSTIKRADLSLECDKIKTNLDIINFAEEKKINIGDYVVLKKRHFLWSIKYYKTHSDFYLMGIKIYSKKEDFDINRILA